MENRTYRYFTEDPMYPFGYGLSYSKFNYRSLDIQPTVIHYDDVIMIDVYVSNEGPYDGEEVSYIIQYSRTFLSEFRAVSVTLKHYSKMHFTMLVALKALETNTLKKIPIWFTVKSIRHDHFLILYKFYQSSRIAFSKIYLLKDMLFFLL